MLCGICHEQKKLVCGPCAEHLVLRNRINLVKSQDQVARARVAEAVNDPRNGNLEAQIASLKAQLARTRQATSQCRARTAQIREQTALQTVQLVALKAESRQRENAYTNEMGRQKAALLDQISGLEKQYKLIYHQTLACQSHCLRQIVSIFTIRRRRRRSGQPPDTLLGFGLVPDTNSLLHHSAASLGAGLERVALFTLLCSSYLGIQLPFQIVLPSQQDLGVGVMHGGTRLPISISRPVRELLRHDPPSLWEFFRALAMVLIDVATLGGRLGVPKLGLEDISRLNELVTQIVVRIASHVHAGVEIQVQSSVPGPDLDTLQDHLITQTEVAAHSGWSVVEVP